MTERRKSSSTMVRFLLFSIAMTVLGFNGGCGGGVQSQATLDEAAEKRVQESKDAMKRFMAKKKAPEPSARKTSKK